MRAEAFMTVDVVTTSPTTPVQDAARLLLSRRVAALPVVDGEGRLVGIVSELDFLRDRVATDPRAHLRPPADTTGGAVARVVSDVMTRDVVALSAAEDAAAFAALFAEHGMKSVPVVRGDQVVGIVSRRDLLRLLTRTDMEVEADLNALLHAERSAVGAWQARAVAGAVVLTGRGSPEVVDGVKRLALSVPGVVRVETRED